MFKSCRLCVLALFVELNVDLNYPLQGLAFAILHCFMDPQVNVSFLIACHSESLVSLCSLT